MARKYTRKEKESKGALSWISDIQNLAQPSSRVYWTILFFLGYWINITPRLTGGRWVPLQPEGVGYEKEEGMAVSAYVLIRVEADKTKSVFETLAKLNEVKTAHTVTGPFDIILLVEGKTLQELGDMILTKIRGVEGISRTMTCVTVETG
jgi:hypothetical protein